MNRFIGLILILIVLTACGSTSSNTETQITSVAEKPQASPTQAPVAQLNQPEQILEYLAQRQESVALVSYTVA